MCVCVCVCVCVRERERERERKKRKREKQPYENAFAHKNLSLTIKQMPRYDCNNEVPFIFDIYSYIIAHIYMHIHTQTRVFTVNRSQYNQTLLILIAWASFWGFCFSLSKILNYRFRFAFLCFYGITSFVGYLMLNPSL